MASRVNLEAVAGPARRAGRARHPDGTRARVKRLASYLWCAPSTLLGCAGALLALPGGRLRIVEGVLEAYGPVIAWALRSLVPLAGGAAALTLGHVVLGVSADALARSRAHERVHVRQYERWGPFFIPAYLAASAWMWLAGRDPYYDNRFERAAYANEGAGTLHAAEGLADVLSVSRPPRDNCRSPRPRSRRFRTPGTAS
jgi:hypothetical protein